jgi:hypothetical protein
MRYLLFIFFSTILFFIPIALVFVLRFIVAVKLHRILEKFPKIMILVCSITLYVGLFEINIAQLQIGKFVMLFYVFCYYNLVCLILALLHRLSTRNLLTATFILGGLECILLFLDVQKIDIEATGFSLYMQLVIAFCLLTFSYYRNIYRHS